MGEGNGLRSAQAPAVLGRHLSPPAPLTEVGLVPASSWNQGEGMTGRLGPSSRERVQLASRRAGAGRGQVSSLWAWSPSGQRGLILNDPQEREGGAGWSPSGPVASVYPQGCGP